MTATVLISLLLGASALATGVFSVITQVRDRGRSIRRQESDISKIEKTIELDETTRDRLAAEAAQINSDERIATEKWWKEQFDAVKDELIEEQRLRRELQKESKKILVWANDHYTWDQRAWELAKKTDPNYPAPPRLQNGDH